ncbi:MAG: universal stress protein [Bacteroidota bacterium]
MKTILLPTDFSPHAHNAFNYALGLAEACHAKVILFHAYHYNASGAFYVPTELIDVVNLDQKDSALKSMERYQKIANAQAGKDVRVDPVMVQGFAIDEILEYTQANPVDLIIMGTRGASGFEGRLLGSVTLSLLERSQVPVIALPDGAEFSPINQIAYATNYEEQDSNALDRLLDFAFLNHAEIHCVHVSGKPGPDEQQRKNMLERQFDWEVTMKDLDFTELEEQDVVKGLLNFINERPMDMLAMLSHRRGFWGRMFHQSISNEVARQIKIPLMVFPMKKHKKPTGTDPVASSV